MNHSTALQREKDGRWDYTMNRRPVGYCDGWRDPRGDDLLPEQMREDLYRQTAQHRAKYHRDGHATADEARECYKGYLLDQRMRVSEGPEDPDVLHRCQAPDCREHTAGSVEVHYLVGHWWLCPEHRNRETVEVLFEVGESWHS